jgi:hypothetical protein
MTAEQFVQRLAQHSNYRPVLIRDQATQDALCARISDLARAGWSDVEIDAVAHAIAKRGIGPQPRDERWFQLADWAALPGNVLTALADAHEQERKGAQAAADFAAIRQQLGQTT